MYFERERERERERTSETERERERASVREFLQQEREKDSAAGESVKLSKRRMTASGASLYCETNS